MSPDVYAKKYPGLLEKLDKVPAHELSEEYGLTVAAIKNMRIRFGITSPGGSRKRGRPPLTTEDKYPGITALLGTKKDIEISAIYGIGRERVRQIRTAAGIERFDLYAETDRKLEPFIPQFGQIPTSDIAKKAGVKLHQAENYRIRHDLPAWTSRAAVDEFIHLLGTMSDGDVSEKTGVTQSTIARHRDLLGIPPFRFRSRWNPIPIPELTRLHNEGLQVTDIAVKLQSTPNTIRKLMAENGISPRRVPLRQPKSECGKGHSDLYITGKQRRCRTCEKLGRERRQAMRNMDSLIPCSIFLLLQPGPNGGWEFLHPSQYQFCTLEGETATSGGYPTIDHGAYNPRPFKIRGLPKMAWMVRGDDRRSAILFPMGFSIVSGGVEISTSQKTPHLLVLCKDVILPDGKIDRGLARPFTIFLPPGGGHYGV